MKILSFDIEEWYCIQNMRKLTDTTRYFSTFDDYLYKILDLLEETNTKATFFCVGKLSEKFPYVIKAIAARGHEVACHSNEHKWLAKMSPKEFFQDTKDAIASLEDLTGKKILSYRAPAFSISKDNLWAFEILSECGIERDSSIYPAIRDFGGFSEFPEDIPAKIAVNGIEIKEYPIRMANILGKQMAYSGGGYFRFFPYWYIRNRVSNSDYSIAYFHISDLKHSRMLTRKEYEDYFMEPGTLMHRLVRYMKSNINTKGAFEKMSRLVRELDFVNLELADKMIDWRHAKVVEF